LLNANTAREALKHGKYHPDMKEENNWKHLGKYGMIAVGKDSLAAIQKEYYEAMARSRGRSKIVMTECVNFC
jgi:hypothetical protein